MNAPDELPKRRWLMAQFRRQQVDRGTSNNGNSYYEDTEGHRHPSTTTITEEINFEDYPEDSPLSEGTESVQTLKEHTTRWWVKRWYKRQIGILAHHAITSQMDVSTPDDTVYARNELISPTGQDVRKMSQEALFETLRDYDDVALAAEGWEYDRYPADYPLLDVAMKDADNIAHLWRATIRPELYIGYDDVWRGELKFVHLLDGSGWPPLGYGGQIDLVADLRDCVRAVELKTGDVQMAHRMQATAHQQAFSEIEGAAIIHVSPTDTWNVEWSESWPQESLWHQFRSEIVLAEHKDTFDF